MSVKISRRAKERAILNALQKNCRMSLREIAEAVRSPISTVHDKIRRFEKDGLIRAYRAILDDEKLGFPVTGFILVSINYPEGKKASQRKVAERIARFPEVQEVHIIAGDWDLLIKIKARCVSSLGRFVTEKLRNVDLVGRTKTLVVFNRVKEDTRLPL